MKITKVQKKQAEYLLTRGPFKMTKDNRESNLCPWAVYDPKGARIFATSSELGAKSDMLRLNAAYWMGFEDAKAKFSKATGTEGD